MSVGEQILSPLRVYQVATAVDAQSPQPQRLRPIQTVTQNMQGQQRQPRNAPVPLEAASVEQLPFCIEGKGMIKCMHSGLEEKVQEEKVQERAHAGCSVRPGIRICEVVLRGAITGKLQ